MFVYSLISSTIQDLFSILPVSLENARWWSFEGQRYVSKSNCYSLHSCCRILAAAGPQISLDDYGPIPRAFQITTSVFQLGRNPANVKLFWISWDHPFFLLSIKRLKLYCIWNHPVLSPAKVEAAVQKAAAVAHEAALIWITINKKGFSQQSSENGHFAWTMGIEATNKVIWMGWRFLMGILR